MIQIDWKRKLSSRKLWVSVAGLITGILAMFRLPDSEISQIGGIILSLGSVISYVFAEGWIDAENAGYVHDELTEARRYD